jgi:cytochrome bd ubiquinol oxidase subunit II
VLFAAALAALLIVPAFVLLYMLDQKSLLPEEGVDEGPEQATEVTRSA